ncbi:MAG: hypothetical protein ACOYWZ_07805 [Bacillota bacterium]
MNSILISRIDIPDITRNPEIVQPEPNPAREVPPRPDPGIQPAREQTIRKLSA